MTSAPDAILDPAAGWSRPSIRSSGLTSRRLWTLLTVWTVACAGAHSSSVGYSWHFFALGARLLPRWSSPAGGLHLYAVHPELQIGPLALLAAAPLEIISRTHAGLIAAALLMPLGLLLLAALARSQPGRLPVDNVTILITGALFLPVWSEVAVHYTHLDDALALTFGAGALLATQQRLPVTSGVLIAAAIDSKPWAAAFAVLLLALPRHHRARAFTAMSAAVTLAWLPYLIGDPATLGLGKFRITNAAASTLNVIGVHSALTPWWGRPAQLIVALAVGMVLIHRGHRDRVLLSAVAARLLLDPQIYPYYTSGLVVGAAAIDLTSCRRFPRWTACAAGFYALDEAGRLMLPPHVRGLIRTSYCLSVLLVLTLSRATPATPSSAPGGASEASPRAHRAEQP